MSTEWSPATTRRIVLQRSKWRSVLRDRAASELRNDPAPLHGEIISIHVDVPDPAAPPKLKAGADRRSDEFRSFHRSVDVEDICDSARALLLDNGVDLNDRAAVERAIINPYKDDVEIGPLFVEKCIAAAKVNVAAGHRGDDAAGI
jgi:hypothetical protein